MFLYKDVYADTTVHLNIKTPNLEIYNQDISVAPCDSDNNGTVKITAYCAVLQSGVNSVWDWSWAPGAFVKSINSIAGYVSKDMNDNDVYHFWGWSLNGSFGSVALNEYELQNNDNIVLDFTDPVDVSTISAPNASGGLVLSNDISSSKKEKKIFDLDKAVSFLKSKQKKDGSFGGGDLYTSWAGMAYGVMNIDSSSLITYLYTHPVDMNLTDIERRSMFLLSLKQNPYHFNNINYISFILKNFDGKQFGDSNLINDDIFAVLILSKSGYNIKDEILNKDINFILSKQKEDGSFEYSVDLTAAAIGALYPFSDDFNVRVAVSKASIYLQNKQNGDGGFNSVYSTSWVMQASNTLGFGFSKNGYSLDDYLTYLEQDDGGMLDYSNSEPNRIWATSYAILAMSRKSWADIMYPVDREEVLDIKINTQALSEKEIRAPIQIENKKDKISPGEIKEKNKIQTNREDAKGFIYNIKSLSNDIIYFFEKIK